MSASLLVDLGNTCLMDISLPAASGGAFFGASGVQIGKTVDLLNANTFCNVFAAGVQALSGDLRLQIQTCDTDTSGSFTDPTSGLAQLPTVFLSGGIVAISSGGLGVFGAAVSGQMVQSGFACGAAFQRPARYARINLVSGTYCGALVVGFISQLKTTGSGGGFSYSPGSGSVNV